MKRDKRKFYAFIIEALDRAPTDREIRDANLHP